MRKTTLLAFIVAAFAGTAYAAAPAFEDVDTNQDGKITAEEAEVIEGLSFDAADANGDGQLDRTEYAAAARNM